MFELTINNQVYNFHFGFGFVKEINKTITADIEGAHGAKREMGLQYHVASLFDGNIESLALILDTANKGQDPRLTRETLEAYIEDESTDIDGLFEKVLDFLRRANCTRKIAQRVTEEVEKAKERN